VGAASITHSCLTATSSSLVDISSATNTNDNPLFIDSDSGVD
jgi:hypothetical protein